VAVTEKRSAADIEALVSVLAAAAGVAAPPPPAGAAGKGAPRG
jgi:hypothetical protein